MKNLVKGDEKKMRYEEREGINQDNEDVEQTIEEVDPNYPNRTDDAPTFDFQKSNLEELRAKKAAMLELKKYPTQTS